MCDTNEIVFGTINVSNEKDKKTADINSILDNIKNEQELEKVDIWCVQELRSVSEDERKNKGYIILEPRNSCGKCTEYIIKENNQTKFNFKVIDEKNTIVKFYNENKKKYKDILIYDDEYPEFLDGDYREAVLTINGIDIIVINTHIPFNFRGKTTSRRQLFMKSYIDYLESIQDKFVVCLGDLNASRDGNRGGHNFLEEIKRLGFIELQDKAEIKEGKDHPTYKKSNLKLDYIFLSSQLSRYIRRKHRKSINELCNLKYLDKNFKEVQDLLDHIGMEFTMNKEWFT